MFTESDTVLGIRMIIISKSYSPLGDKDLNAMIEIRLVSWVYNLCSYIGPSFQKTLTWFNALLSLSRNS